MVCRITPLLLFCLFLTSAVLADEDAYVQSIEHWRQQRLNNLRKPDGWLSLIGLFWLNEGANTFGSDTAYDIRFPPEKADAFLGTLTLRDGVVSVKIRPGADVRCNGERVMSMTLQTDKTGQAAMLSHRSLIWHIIERDGRFAVRLKDSESALLQQFKGTESFPIDPHWAITAKFEKADSAKFIKVSNGLGNVSKEPSPGTVVFSHDGSDYRLDVIAEEGSEQYFLIFADQTSGDETYGGGRFLYIDKADDAGRTLIDFNKAYNPPCVFTAYATCPLPPRQNILPFKVPAGEKVYGDGHH
jgi:uncharacterized protein